MFKECSTIDTNCPEDDCTSGEVSCKIEPEIQCWRSGKCGAGSPFQGTHSVIDKIDCLDLCQKDDSCKWFTFEYENDGRKSCTFWGDCTSIDECPICETGESECKLPKEGNEQEH